jgi:hypothetical protein
MGSQIVGETISHHFKPCLYFHFRRRGIMANAGEAIYGGTKSMYNQSMYDTGPGGGGGGAKSMYNGYDGSPASNLRKGRSHD